MADLTLAEVNGQVWLVKGDQYVDDLLGNTLPPGVTLEFVACASRQEAFAIWQANATEPTDGAIPWTIHPGIVHRIKGSLDEPCIRFTPWSAMLTNGMEDTIAGAAEWLGAHPAGRLTLRQFCPAEAPPGLADLQRLRGLLVAGALTRAGADANRLDHETSHSDAPADSERLDFVSVASAAITAT